jgi:hypothetical protein
MTNMRMIVFSGWVLALLVLSGPFQTNAQQSKKVTSAETPAQAIQTVRFDSGKSALKIPLDIDNNIIRIQVSVNRSNPHSSRVFLESVNPVVGIERLRLSAQGELL